VLVRLIAVSTLREFWVRQRDPEQPLRAWYHEAKQAQWKNPAEIKEVYRSASVLRGGRVVFNIAGNNHRLVVAIHFPLQICYIKFVGTHADYDRIDADVVDQNFRKGQS
jgi:mRNA interferase HigB